MKRLLPARQQRFVHDKFVEEGAQHLWKASGHIWARLYSRPSRLLLRAGVEEQVITHRLALRHNENIAAGDRLRLGERVFIIHFIHDVDGRARQMECFCEERSAH